MDFLSSDKSDSPAVTTPPVSSLQLDFAYNFITSLPVFNRRTREHNFIIITKEHNFTERNRYSQKYSEAPNEKISAKYLKHHFLLKTVAPLGLKSILKAYLCKLSVIQS